MTNRKIAAQATKRKLVETALELIKERGFDAVNVDEITRKAHVAKGTFYTYFKRKQDIMREISRQPFADIQAELTAMTQADILEKLTHYFRRFMERVEYGGIQICREWTRAVLNPNSPADGNDGKKWFYDLEMLTDILNNAVQSKELSEQTPVDLLARVIISELYGMMLGWCMSDGAFEPLEWTDKFCDFQLNAVLKPYLKQEE